MPFLFENRVKKCILVCFFVVVFFSLLLLFFFFVVVCLFVFCCCFLFFVFWGVGASIILNPCFLNKHSLYFQAQVTIMLHMTTNEISNMVATTGE